MSVAVLVITDGRGEYLERTVASLSEMLDGDVTEWWMYDDSGDDEHRQWLRERFPWFTHFNAGTRQGFGGAIRHSWAMLLQASAADHVAHVEADFVLNRPVDLQAMAGVLDCHWYLAQLVLKRQPWNKQERKAGGIVEQHPHDYTDRDDGLGHHWLEHRRFFSTNVCLYRRGLMEAGWPEGDQSEGRFGLRLLDVGFDGVKPGDVRFGFWGQRSDPPWIEHIGHVRAGKGY